VRRNLPSKGRMWLGGVVTVGLLLCGAHLAGAAESAHGDGGALLKDFLYRCLNFALLAGLLGYFLRKPLGDALAARRQAVATSLEESRQAREEAEARAERLARQLEAGGREIEALRRQMEEETVKERAQLLEQARQTAAAIREEALRHATRQIERARRRLQAEAATLAIQLAERQLADGLTADDQRRLVDDTLRQLGEQP